jgi:hypothetical protein
MGLLDWTKKGAKPRQESVNEQNPTPSPIRLKQPGDPFKRGDRIVVYEAYHLGLELKPDPRYAPGIVSSVHHDGTLVSYEKGGRLPASAAIEDVRHATERDASEYAEQFSAIEAKLQRRDRSVSWER